MDFTRLWPSPVEPKAWTFGLISDGWQIVCSLQANSCSQWCGSGIQRPYVAVFDIGPYYFDLIRPCIVCSVYNSRLPNGFSFKKKFLCDFVACPMFGLAFWSFRQKVCLGSDLFGLNTLFLLPITVKNMIDNWS